MNSHCKIPVGESVAYYRVNIDGSYEKVIEPPYDKLSDDDDDDDDEFDNYEDEIHSKKRNRTYTHESFFVIVMMLVMLGCALMGLLIFSVLIEEKKVAPELIVYPDETFNSETMTFKDPPVDQGRIVYVGIGFTDIVILLLIAKCIFS
jgi:hypothetical protein